VSAAEDDVVSMSFPKWGIEIDKWVSYRCNSHFTTPTDGFEFTVSASALDDTTREVLKRGEEFQIKINGHVQASGYIDSVTTTASRDAGTILRVEGCDKLAQVVRAGIDPRKRFTDAQTLLDVLVAVFAPFGYTIDSFLVSNDVNRNIRSGQVRGNKVSKKKGKVLKSFAMHQNKPYPGEGAFAFASRIAQRFGLWIWLSAEGNLLIVSTPTFDQPARYQLVDKLDGGARTTNIEHGEVHEDGSHQPSCIVATGFSFGGEADRSRLKVFIANNIVALGSDFQLSPGVKAVRDANPDANVLQSIVFNIPNSMPHPSAQPIYLHDQESQTLEQLQNFARRELALRQHESLRVSYTVAGHSNQGTIWCVDTIVDVDDDARGIHEPLWVLSRSFEMSRAGTFTHLELIRPYTLQFS
jgi:prophage tail gpP-like protein